MGEPLSLRMWQGKQAAVPTPTAPAHCAYCGELIDPARPLVGWTPDSNFIDIVTPGAGLADRIVLYHGGAECKCEGGEQ